MSASPDRSRVTVVMPTRNRRDQARRAIEAIFRCETGGAHVYIHAVDDGSTDDTSEMLRDLAAAAPAGFRLIPFSAEGVGSGAARNIGIQAAETDLIFFTDDDCIAEPGWILGLLHADWTPEVGGVGGRIHASDAKTWVARYCRFDRYNEFPRDDGPITYLNTANCAFRRDLLNQLGGFENMINLGGEDIELSWRVVAAGFRLAYQPDAAVAHYHRETLDALLKTYRLRGYGSTLRDALWKKLDVTPDLLRREEKRQALWPLGALAIPKRFVRLLGKGVPAADAARFAWLEWRRAGVHRSGRIEMLRRILSGEQSLERSGMVKA